MDITETQQLGKVSNPEGVARTSSVIYPKKVAFNSTVKSLIRDLEKQNMYDNLKTFTSFHTRYYKSDYGAQSSAWLLGKVNDTITESGAAEHGVYVKPFEHPWGQSSIIATIPGKSNKTVVIGAHQDSINMFLPSLLSAPGADDDGSGTVTILEALRVLLSSKDIQKGKGENTVEFHWYSAEEGGLLGSQAIFQSYEKEGKDVKAMLQQDMTGYIQKTLDAGKKERVGVITDFVDPGLTEFIKEVITEVCIPSVPSQDLFGIGESMLTENLVLRYTLCAHEVRVCLF
jgi:bacterial leucyl aminopeptidase